MNRDTVEPKTGKVLEECLSILLDEIQQAVAWSRPSILFGIHRSMKDQANAILAMERKLTNLDLKVEHIDPNGDALNFVEMTSHIAIMPEAVLFIQGLGGQLSSYDDLNLNREWIVENRIKVIFWLTTEELSLLSRRAPDFWAFRHRVIEFPSGRVSRKDQLPSGLLLWNQGYMNTDFHDIHEKIDHQKRLLHDIPADGEMLTAHANAVANLAYYSWLIGDVRSAQVILQHEIEMIDMLNVADVQASLLNILAIYSFDENEHDDAIRWINRALEVNPSDSYLWSNHGIICRSVGQVRKSLPSLKKGVSLNHRSFEGWRLIGYVFMSMGRYTDALTCFEKSIEIRPSDSYLDPALALCQSNLGNNERFNSVIQHMAAAETDAEYLSICRYGLLGNPSTGLAMLQKQIVEDKYPRVFPLRDPNFHFIFGPQILQDLIQSI